MAEATVSEALEFLRRHPHVFLLARRPDGFPTGYAMMARVHDGAVDFSTYRASAKVQNLLRDGVAGIVAAAEEPGDDRVLVAEGPVTLLDGSHWDTGSGPDDGREVARALVPAEIAHKVQDRHDSGKRIVLRVTLESARFSTAPAP
jgi:hypothetical protein